MAANADHNKNGVASKVSGYLADYHRFGWLLFILLRVHAFGRSKDLVTCTTALVSVLVSLVFASISVIALLYLAFHLLAIL